jgi:hypothetical protein
MRSRGPRHRRICRLEAHGLDAVRSYPEGVWGDAATRFRLMAENTADRAGEVPER